MEAASKESPEGVLLIQPPRNRRTVSPLRLGTPRQGHASFLRLSGTPIPFPRSPASPLQSLSPLTRLSTQDPFVEPIFTWGEGGKGKH